MERIEPAVKARRVSRNEGSDPASPNGKAVSNSERTELMLSSLRRDSPKPKLRAAGWLKIADENPWNDGSCWPKDLSVLYCGPQKPSRSILPIHRRGPRRITKVWARPALSEKRAREICRMLGKLIRARVISVTAKHRCRTKTPVINIRNHFSRWAGTIRSKSNRPARIALYLPRNIGKTAAPSTLPLQAPLASAGQAPAATMAPRPAARLPHHCRA